MPDQAQLNLDAAKTFLTAVESMDGGHLDAFFAPEVEQIEWPNAFKPQGDRRDLAQLKADLEKARGILRSQSYEVVRELAAADCVVLEMVWRGVMEIEVGALKAGQALTAHCVAVFDFKDGQVVGLRNYDCFDPF